MVVETVTALCGGRNSYSTFLKKNGSQQQSRPQKKYSSCENNIASLNKSPLFLTVDNGCFHIND